MPALTAGRARHSEAERAGVVQASREETAECSGTVGAAVIVMGFGCAESVERDDPAGTSPSAVMKMAGNWMIPPRYLAMDAVGSRAFAA
jgi:hypothetical protein